MEDDLEGLTEPNCERCLTRMQLAGTDERPFWRCPSCGLVVLV
jgi:tRNA(Ile2) C34 agmatinyltransferase TiaS